MSASKHTPGPWKIYRAPNNGPIIGIGGRDGDGVTDPRFGLWCDGEEREANARLIAAAPDMLEALRNLVSYSELAAPPPVHVAAAKAAIAKAEAGE